MRRTHRFRRHRLTPIERVASALFDIANEIGRHNRLQAEQIELMRLALAETFKTKDSFARSVMEERSAVYGGHHLLIRPRKRNPPRRKP